MREHDRGEGRTSGERGGFLAWLGRFDAGRFIAAELMVLVAVIACFSKAQSDTYWQLAAGRVMSQTGRVMMTDEFSHTSHGAVWMNWEWLSEVIFYHAYRQGGMPLLTALCALLAFGSCYLSWRLIRGSIEDRVLLLAMALPLVTPGWSLRAQAFTLFLVVAVLHLVLRRRFWVLPPLFTLWANLHPGVALGLVVLFGDFIAAVVSRRGYRRRAVFGVLCFGATLLTPLGPFLWLEVRHSLQRSSVNAISEWLPPVFTPRYILFWLAASTFVWLAATRWRRLDQHTGRSVVVVAGLMLILALRASRNIVPFGLLVAPALSRLLWRDDVIRRPRTGPTKYPGAVVRLSVFSASVIVALLIVYYRWTLVPPPPDWAPVSREAASAIRNCPGPIYNHYNNGGFIIWFVPEQKVFLDSRQDPYPLDLMRAQGETQDPAALRRLLAQYHVRCAVLKPGSPEVRSLSTMGWMESYRDRQWVVTTAPAAGAR